MRYLVLLMVGAVACGGGSRSTAGPSLPTPTTKATSEMAEGNPDLRPVAIAAAGYFKETAAHAGGRLGFFGVFINQLEVPRLSSEIEQRFGFTSKPRLICTAVVTVPAGTRPSGGIPAGTPQNCRMENADMAFSLSGFRRVADTIYVGSNTSEVRGGSPVSGEICFVMVWRDTAWTGAGHRGGGAKTCGK